MISKITKSARYALLAEVETTPKPGLVDLYDTGSHQDMCYQTFVKSVDAILPRLTEMAELSYDWHGSLQSLFPKLRMIGIEAETAMLRATQGVNTHKGAIFSMGIICASSAWSFRNQRDFTADTILKTCREMTEQDICQDFKNIASSTPKTKGEKFFLDFGIKGIRGEAKLGFPSVKENAYPYLSHLLSTGLCKNQAYINTLLLLMSRVDDTTIVSRSDLPTLDYVKETARSFLDNGGIRSPKGFETLTLLNRDFIKRNISPGGSADLLAVTIFLWELMEH